MLVLKLLLPAHLFFELKKTTIQDSDFYNCYRYLFSCVFQQRRPYSSYWESNLKRSFLLFTLKITNVNLLSSYTYEKWIWCNKKHICHDLENYSLNPGSKTRIELDWRLFLSQQCILVAHIINKSIFACSVSSCMCAIGSSVCVKSLTVLGQGEAYRDLVIMDIANDLFCTLDHEKPKTPVKY